MYDKIHYNKKKEKEKTSVLLHRCKKMEAWWSYRDIRRVPALKLGDLGCSAIHFLFSLPWPIAQGRSVRMLCNQFLCPVKSGHLESSCSCSSWTGKFSSALLVVKKKKSSWVSITGKGELYYKYRGGFQGTAEWACSHPRENWNQALESPGFFQPTPHLCFSIYRWRAAFSIASILFQL